MCDASILFRLLRVLIETSTVKRVGALAPLLLSSFYPYVRKA